MFRTAVLALAVLMAGVSPVAAQTANDAVEMRAHRAFVVWVQHVTDLLERTSTVNDVFLQFVQGAQQNESREDFVARAGPVREAALSGRALLAEVRAELDATEPYNAEGAFPDQVLMAETMLRDSRTYIGNLDDILSGMIALIDAMASNDEAAVQRVAPRLVRSAGYLVEGQIVTLRARQQIIPTTESAYHSMGAMIAMYEGMRAIVMPNVIDRDAALIEAAQSAARWGVSGRAALAESVAQLPEVASREREISAQILTIEEQFYVANDQLIELLEAAATDAATHDQRYLNLTYMPRVTAIEMRYQELNQQQMTLFAQLTEADNPL